MIVLLLFIVFTVSSALDMSIISYNQKSDDEVKVIYEYWLQKHGKAYNGLGEKERRFEIFKDNLRFIDEHNAENRTYKVGLNRFADLTNEEYRAKYLGTRIDPKRRIAKTRSNRYAPRLGDQLPESVDWRKEGAVAEVKDQGSCGKDYFLFFFLDESNFLTD